MIVVGITGASGSLLGIRLIEELLNAGEEVAAIVSKGGWRTIEYELNWNRKNNAPIRELLNERGIAGKNIALCEYENDDFFAPIASGTSSFDSLIVIPSSMKTLSAIAHGYADSLLTRTCDVALKERRTLILVPRETPLSSIHLENMLKASQAGAIILPPVISLYTRPQSVSDMVDFIVGKAMNLLGKQHTLFAAWGKE